MSANQPRRRGHAGIRAIIEDMVDVLPPETTNNRQYIGCHTTFGMMKACLTRAEESEDPAKHYIELQKNEQTLRQRLIALKSRNGIPVKMQNCLDDLRDAIKAALEQGVDKDYIIKGIEDMIEAPEPTLAEKEARKPPTMVPAERLKKVKEALKKEQEKNKKLNDENNRLAIELKRVTMERDQLRR